MDRYLCNLIYVYRTKPQIIVGKYSIPNLTPYSRLIMRVATTADATREHLMKYLHHINWVNAAVTGFP